MGDWALATMAVTAHLGSSLENQTAARFAIPGMISVRPASVAR
jgi:hypothetical protein